MGSFCIKSITAKKKATFGVGIFSSSLLLAFSAICIYSPTFGSHADESKKVKVSATLTPVVSLSLDTSALNFDITPTASGVFSSKSVTATVDTNSSGGYELYFSSEDNTTNMTSLVSESVIASDFNDAVTSANMASNRWGYSLDNMNFSKIPASSSVATLRNLSELPTSAEKVTSVYLGMKLNSDLPSGAYSKTVVFSAIAHPDPNVNWLARLESMQDPNLAKYCANTYTPTSAATLRVYDRTFYGDSVPSAVLEDLRDQTEYTISKLADGRCWMAENLRITDTELSSTLSDLAEGETFTVPATTASNYWGSGPDADINRMYYDATYGGYYPWYTATAGSGTLSSVGVEASSSICPKGWKLPSGGSSGEFQGLINKYNSSAKLQGAPGFKMSGYIYGDMSNYGRYAYYWGSTASSSYNRRAQLFGFGSSSVGLGEDNKMIGNPLHCIARPL